MHACYVYVDDCANGIFTIFVNFYDSYNNVPTVMLVVAKQLMSTYVKFLSLLYIHIDLLLDDNT